MNTRDRNAAPEHVGASQVSDSSGIGMPGIEDATQVRFCADTRFDDACGLDWDQASLHDLQTLAERWRVDPRLVVATLALAVLARLRACEQLRAGVQLAREPEGISGYFVNSICLATDPAQT
ncbi:MAG: hypothetical protein ACREP7_14905, partial [Lysobacter sp.]